MLENILFRCQKERSDAINITAYTNCYAYANGYGIAFLSCALRKSDASIIAKSMKKNETNWNAPYVTVKRGYVGSILEKDEYDVYTYKGINDYVQLVFKKKAAMNKETFAIFADHPVDINFPTSDITDKFFDGVVAITSVPLIREWKDFLFKALVKQRSIAAAEIKGDSVKYGFSSAIMVSTYNNEVKRVISNGLKSGEISIQGCNEISDTTKEVVGVDSYQKAFNDVLAKHTCEVFKPRFDPTKSSVSKKVNDFFDISMYYNNNITSYDVQKNVMEACSRTLDHNKNVLISGQTGSGKTILAIGSIAAHAKKPNYSVIVLVPSKLITRWVDGIKSVVPLSNVYAVNNVHELLEATKTMDNPLSQRSTWIVMSENAAKTNYDLRPAVLRDDKSNRYVCPHCGKPIMMYHTRFLNGESTSNGRRISLANEDDFYKKNDDNSHCKYVLDEENGSSIGGCGAFLWTAATKPQKDNPNDISTLGWKLSKQWTKIDKLGWIMQNRIEPRIKDIEKAEKNISDEAPKTWKKTLAREKEALTKATLEDRTGKYPKRYSIAKYIRKHMNHKFDYLIADEVHELVNDSLQGRAFGTILGCVWKSIFLTGTLSNGYPSGLFYLLFRTQTRKMIEDGYNYGSVKDFEEKYGVKETTTVFNVRTNRYGGVTRNRAKKTAKTLPGISPTLVADYLMDYMVSVSKKDIKKDLCKYSEIPVEVAMDTELANSYQRIIERVITSVTTSSGMQIVSSARRAVAHALNKAAMFLDQPYGIDVVSTVTGDVIELPDNVIRNKEKKLIEIAKNKKNNGEKMLIFCEYTKKLDIVNRLANLLNDNGVNAVSMSEKVALNSRQKWLTDKAKEGIDAVILNPTLVDVGLNLLDYTTIIFYEVGTKVTTVRQASQRSNRINQTHPVSVYFMYYKDTIQENILGAISQKLTASKAIEGDFSESALQNMTEDTDILTKLVNSIVKNEKIEITMDTEDEEDTESSSQTTDATQPTNKTASTFGAKIKTYYKDREQFFFAKPQNKISFVA